MTQPTAKGSRRAEAGGIAWPGTGRLRGRGDAVQSHWVAPCAATGRRPLLVQKRGVRKSVCRNDDEADTRESTSLTVKGCFSCLSRKGCQTAERSVSNDCKSLRHIVCGIETEKEREARPPDGRCAENTWPGAGQPGRCPRGTATPPSRGRHGKRGSGLRARGPCRSSQCAGGASRAAFTPKAGASHPRGAQRGTGGHGGGCCGASNAPQSCTILGNSRGCKRSETEKKLGFKSSALSAHLEASGRPPPCLGSSRRAVGSAHRAQGKERAPAGALGEVLMRSDGL